MSLNFVTVLRQAARDQAPEPAASFVRAPFEPTEPGHTAVMAQTADPGENTKGAQLTHFPPPRKASTQRLLFGDSPEAKR